MKLKMTSIILVLIFIIIFFLGGGGGSCFQDTQQIFVIQHPVTGANINVFQLHWSSTEGTLNQFLLL